MRRNYNEGDHGYSYQVQKSLSKAIYRATVVIELMHEQATKDQSLELMHRALELERDQFDADEEDYGYGRGCLGSVIEDLLILQKELGEEVEIKSTSIGWPKLERIDVTDTIRKRKQDIIRIGKEFGFQSLEFVRIVQSQHTGSVEHQDGETAEFEGSDFDPQGIRLEGCEKALQSLLQVPVRITITDEKRQNEMHKESC